MVDAVLPDVVVALVVALAPEPVVDEVVVAVEVPFLSLPFGSSAQPTNTTDDTTNAAHKAHFFRETRLIWSTFSL